MKIINWKSFWYIRVQFCFALFSLRYPVFF